jgi:AcrR family transcriptional regulator
MAKQVQLEWVKPPLQARSQQTLERLLDAAEAIIDEKGLENATVAEIARRAGSSVGAFYTRFADKEGLMRCVFERFNEQAAATTESVLSPDRWRGVTITEALELLITFMARILSERRRLIVAMLVRTAADPSLGALGQELHATVSQHVLALIAHRGARLTHPDPVAAVGVAVWMVLSALELRMLYGPGHVLELDDDEVVAREMARMVVSYVGLEQDAAREPTAARHTPDTTWEKPQLPGARSAALPRETEIAPMGGSERR